MAIELPENRKEIEAEAQADVQAELQNSNPFLRRSYLLAIIRAMSGRLFDFYNQIREMLIDIFPDTARGSFLDRWGGWVGITRNGASTAAGFCNFTGTLTTAIPDSTQVSSQGGIAFETSSASAIAAESLNVTELTRSAGTAFATTDLPHNLGSGMSVTIVGANETEYNGTYTIVATDVNKFTYDIVGTPVSPATGTITADVERALVEIISVDLGSQNNLDGSTPVTLSTPIAGVDSTALVGFGGVGGGVDSETDEDYRIRVRDRWANPLTLFNVQAITEQAQSVPGVTRVFVFPVTPDVGDVTVYFLRDNDVDIIPSPAEVTDVKNALLEITPANTDPANLFVDGPVPNTVDFTFLSITPQSIPMRNAIEENLAQLFRENVEVGVNLTSDTYRSAIFNTVNPETLEPLQAFTLSAPSGDVVIAANEIPVLGTVVF